MFKEKNESINYYPKMWKQEYTYEDGDLAYLS